MKKLAIINTSTGCTDYLDHGYDIKTARLRVIMGEDSYLDFAELTAEEFFSKIAANPDILPSSSTPNYVDYEDLLKECEKEGYEEALIITISSKLSASYAVAVNVADEYEGNLKVSVYDSLSAGLGEGYLSVEAAKMAKEGKSVAEIVKHLDELHDNYGMYLVVDSLRLLIKNGRLSGASGFIGSALKIKPILEVVKEGTIETLVKIRSSKKALRGLVDHFVTQVQNVEDFVAFIHTSDNPEAEQFLRDELAEKFPGKTVLETPVTPVLGCHTDCGVVALGYFKK